MGPELKSVGRELPSGPSISAVPGLQGAVGDSMLNDSLETVNEDRITFSG